MTRTIALFAVIIAALSGMPGQSKSAGDATAYPGTIEAALLEACRVGDTKEAVRLLNEGADPNTTDTWGQMPILIAAEHGHPGIVESLLRHGVDPNLTGKDGQGAFGKAFLSNRSAGLSYE